MVVSLREIGAFIDPLDESIGLRHVASHHRWLQSEADVSLSDIGKRYDPGSVRLRFLWYNTFLMRVRLAVVKGLADCSTPWEVLDALGVEPKKLLGMFDVCDLLPSGPGPVPGLREACKLAGSAVDYVIDELGGVKHVVNAIIDMVGAEQVIEEILILAGVPRELVLEEKPALKLRAQEIGDVLRQDHYDLVALCETWNGDLRDILVEKWDLQRNEKHLATGKPEGDAFFGDGLLFGSTDGRIIDRQRHEYTTRGIDRTSGPVLAMLTDDELWARKGVMLVRIDVGVGVLDVYFTHLYFGTGLGLDGIPAVGPFLYPPNNTEREDVRSAQLKEFSGFFESTHHGPNVAVVCGDFNIDATGQDPEYSGVQALQQFISRHDLQDMWLSPHGEFAGCTGGNFGKICPPAQSHNDSRFCNEATNVDLSNGYRIDFLLVERPQTCHSFMLDITRVRRRSFPRPQVTEDQAHMSDHLGLDCTLLASQK